MQRNKRNGQLYLTAVICAAFLLTACGAPDFSLPPLPAVTDSILSSESPAESPAVGLRLDVWTKHTVYDEFSGTNVKAAVSEHYPLNLNGEQALLNMQIQVGEHAFQGNTGKMSVMFFSDGEPVMQKTDTGDTAVLVTEYTVGSLLELPVCLKTSSIGSDLEWCVICSDSSELTESVFDSRKNRLQFMQFGSIRITKGHLRTANRSSIPADTFKIEKQFTAAAEMQNSILIQCSDHFSEAFTGQDSDSVLSVSKNIWLDLAAPFEKASAVILLDSVPVQLGETAYVLDCELNGLLSTAVPVSVPESDGFHRLSVLLIDKDSGNIYMSAPYLVGGPYHEAVSF